METAAPTLPPEVPRYLTVKATAARLGYSAQTVAMMVQEGRLPAVNIAARPGQTEACYRILASATVAPSFTSSAS